MKPLAIISGAPGSGKTTLAQGLARRSASGVHVVTDEFYRFLAHRLDPSTPESRTQNTSVVKAFLNAARSFHEDGYDVYVDGVIGPWWLDDIVRIFPRFDYVILHADLPTMSSRAPLRSAHTQASA